MTKSAITFASLLLLGHALYSDRRRGLAIVDQEVDVNLSGLSDHGIFDQFRFRDGDPGLAHLTLD